jgi:hypothetical protein
MKQALFTEYLHQVTNKLLVNDLKNLFINPSKYLRVLN